MRKLEMNMIYTITHNKTNKTIYATDNYNNYITYVKNHFPERSYEYNDELNYIVLKSKNFTFSSIVLNKDYILE